MSLSPPNPDPAVMPAALDELARVMEGTAIGTQAHQAFLATLSRERSLLVTLIDHLPDLVYVKDTASRFILANRATAETMGVSSEALIGRTDHDFYPKELADAYRADELAVMQSSQPLMEREEPTSNRPGAERWILTSKMPLLDPDGRVVGLLGIGRDITARRAAELALRQANSELEARVQERTEALARINDELRADIASRQELQQRLESASLTADSANRAKDLFLANMSHEMRTPLNGVLGMAELLLGTRLEREQHHFAEIIRDSGEALLTLVEDLLDLSKIEAGKLDIVPLRFDLRRLADEAVALAAFNAESKRLKLTLDWHEATPTQVIGDAGRIRQVITNLMNNAVKFTEQGSVTLAIDAPAAGKIRIAVTDTGPGLDQELRERLFQPFVQGDASSNRHHGGTGLGLALSRRIAQLMGGDLEVASEPGHGATFTALLPLPGATEDLTPATASAIPHGSTSRRERHTTPYTFTRRWWLLLVEDNPLHRQMAMEMLEGLGLKIDVAANGQEAVELAAHSPFDGILMDCHMSVMDGFAATRAIRAGNGPCRSIPIIALTADALPADRNRCLAAGMDDHLPKPIGRAALVDTLARHLHAEVIAGVPALPDPVSSPSGRFTTPRPRVLVVDDNFANRQVAAAMCRRLGCNVVEADSGLAALRIIVAGGVSLALLDVNMPGMDGTEVCRCLRSTEITSGSHLPVIGCSAGLHHQTRTACLAAGMDAVTNKPLSLNELREALRPFIHLPTVDPPSPAPAPAPRRPVVGALPPSDILDWTVITQHLELNGGAALVKRLIAHFRTDAPAQLKRLADAIAANDYKQTEAVAHRLLGSARAVGLARLSTLCHELERTARERRDWPPVRRLDPLHSAVHEAESALTAIEPRLEAESP